jgi:hypothetical protein
MPHFRAPWRLVGLAVLAAALAGAARPAAQDTWTGVERIVAVGDVHGDYEQFVKVLRAADCLDEKGDWAGAKTHLVQVGDVLDRGPDSRRVMDLLMKLEGQAAAAGGAVHSLIGNHEAMVLLGDWFYVHPGETAAFGGAEAYRKAMAADGLYGRWIRGHNAAIKINDIVFVHAGISRESARRTLAEINEAVREQLRKGAADGLATDLDGPLWYRGLALGDEGEVASDLKEVLGRYGAGRMVIGHTVASQGVVSRAGGRLLRIDVGMTAQYGGPAACLVVEKGVLYEVRHPKVRRKLDPVRPEGQKEGAERGTHASPRGFARGRAEGLAWRPAVGAPPAAGG